MACLQREFLPSNDTYKTKTSAGNTLNFIRGNNNVTHSAQGKTVFWREIFCLEYPSWRSEKGYMFISQTTDFHFANYRFSFRKLQIFISQTTDSLFANYRFSFRKLQILISQTTDFHFANYRFPFRFVPFRFANYSKPFNVSLFWSAVFLTSNFIVLHCTDLRSQTILISKQNSLWVVRL